MDISKLISSVSQSKLNEEEMKIIQPKDVKQPGGAEESKVIHQKRSSKDSK